MSLQEIELGNSGLRTPQIGFGCAALLGRSDRRESLRALDAAWEEGIRFFDTARSYGYGESEALLGEFMQGRREQAVIATKFGILPARQAAWKNAARFIARKVLAVMPSARTLVRRGAATQFSENQFTLPVLQQSVEASLRKLKTECVDFLFLHAAPASVLEQDDLLEAMARLVEVGKVRVAGLSAEPDVIELALSRKTPLSAMQFPCNVFDLSAAMNFSRHGAGEIALVANHPFGGVARVQQCRTVLQALAQQNDLDAALREKLGAVDDAVFADVVLNAILRDTGIHVVIPAMMRVEHIRDNVRAVTESRFDSRELAQIRQTLAAGAAAQSA
jgi:aryl-alcohol dehydrogenase-like predicted oxidoreductase